MKREDHQPIEYIPGTSASDRRFCRRLITAVKEVAKYRPRIVIACSGGIDSTVLVHAAGQALRLDPYGNNGGMIQSTAVYINHNFRPTEVLKEASHVTRLASLNLSFPTGMISLDLDKGAGLQERARDARYQALKEVVWSWNKREGNCQRGLPAVWMAHNANDNAETKLFQFLKGKPVTGIPVTRYLSPNSIILDRPLLAFTRAEIERYARCFQLTWCEDSSNATDDYARNRIRHHLIPWVEEHINPGFVSMMAGQEN